MNDLIELAERCEKATGPDPMLDALICIAVGLSANNPIAAPGGWCVGSITNPSPVKALYYTGSLDAAMTLVPERQEVVITRCADGSAYAEVGNMRPAATPALALCAAALRAKALGDTE